MSETGCDDRLREAAVNRGLKLVKSRIRTPGKGDYGRYGLTDAGGRKLLGFGKSGLTATAEEIEDFLHKGALSDWKSSLRTAGVRPSPRPGRRKAAGPERRTALKPAPEPEPEPEPGLEPPPLVIPAKAGTSGRPADTSCPESPLSPG